MNVGNTSSRLPEPGRFRAANGPSLRTGMVMFILLAMVPLCALYLSQVARQLESDRDHLESRLRERANHLAFAVEGKIRSSFDALHGLASAERLQQGPEGAGALLRDVLEERPDWITLFLASPDGEILHERGVPLGESGLNLAGLPAFRDQIRQGHVLASHYPIRSAPAGSPLTGAPMAGARGMAEVMTAAWVATGGRRAVIVQVPLNLQGRGRHIIGVVMAPAILQSLLERAGDSRAADAAALLSIADARGEIIVEYTHVEYAGADRVGPAQVWPQQGRDVPLNGYGRLNLRDGPAVYVAVGAIPGTRWQARAAVAAPAFEAAQRQQLVLALVFALLCLCFGVALALLLARRIIVPLERFSEAARAPAEFVPAVPDSGSSWREIGRLHDALQGARGKRLDDARQLREAERRVRDSEQRLELAQEAGAVGFFDYEFARRLAVWTPGLARLFGIGVQHFEGSLSDWARRIAPDDAQALRRYFVRAMALRQGEVACEFRAILPGGQMRWLACRGRLFYDDSGAPIRMVGVSVDVTTAKTADSERTELLAREQYVRAEAEQRALEAERARALLETLMAHVPEGITIVEGPPYYAAIITSAYGLEAVGPLDDFSQGECGNVGRGGSLLLPGGVDAPTPEQTPLYRASRLGESVVNEEFILVRRDGRRLAVLINATPIRSRDGRLLGAISSWRDITTLKRLEQDLRNLLEREQEARRAAEEANRAKDEFLAMLGHELRNPLAAISAAARVLERQVGGAAATVTAQADVTVADAPPRADPVVTRTAARAREIIARQTGHLARLTDDLLDTGRAINGKIILQRQRVDLAEAVTRALSALAATGSLERHHLQVDLHAAWIDADATRIEQIASNLIINAIKYTPPGGAIHVRVRRDDNNALLQVADSGIGISPALLPRVFDLFVQGEHGLQRDLGGLGIGLTLVRRLVELHGGTVQAQSDGLDCGSSFTVRLLHLQSGIDADPPCMVLASGHALSRPVSETSVARPQDCEETLTPQLMRIALIEDNDDGREMLKTLLEIFGHTVFEAADGESGVEIVTRTLPDVALFDIGLPGIDGYEAARRIRAMPATSDVALVALTGYGLPEDRRRAVEAGFDAHLVKPVDPDKLQAMLAVLRRGPNQAILVDA